MRVVDPHIDLWNLERLHYPWLATPQPSFIGEYASLAKMHEAAEFLADAAGIQVLKVVHIEAGHDTADPLAETRWLQSVAATPGNRGIPQGIVATQICRGPMWTRSSQSMPPCRTCAGFARS
jgi:predicted TIM-barrel fold metal-dependent hydrolase